MHNDYCARFNEHLDAKNKIQPRAHRRARDDGSTSKAIQDIAILCLRAMSTVAPPRPTAPFEPVLKADAAAVLNVNERTIDNHIKRGLLPASSTFGYREMWHPDVFYGHLGEVLLGRGEAPAQDTVREPLVRAPGGLPVLAWPYLPSQRAGAF